MPFQQGVGRPPIPTPAPDRAGRPSLHLPSWLETDPSQALTEILGIPVLVENDANLAALGEACDGAARGAHLGLYLNIATGFGAGIVINGRLLRGAHGVAGDADVSIREDGDICLCGNRGCMTTLRRNGPGMADDLTTALGRKPNMEEIIALADTQDVTISRWLADLGRNVAQSLIGFVTLLNPDLIVVDADLGPAALPLADGLHETLRRRTPPMTHNGLRVVDPQSRTLLRPHLSGHVRLALDGLEAVLEPVARAVDRDDFAVVQEAVEDRGGEDFVAEDLAPFAEGLVRGEDDRALLVALGDHLEDQVRLGAFEWLVADFVDHEDARPQVGAGVCWSAALPLRRL